MDMDEIQLSRDPDLGGSSEIGKDEDATYWQQLKATIVRNWLRKWRNRKQAFRVSQIHLQENQHNRIIRERVKICFRHMFQNYILDRKNVTQILV